MYFYNRLVLDFLRERKEMVEQVRLERKEWVDTLRENNRQYNELLRLAVEAMTYTKSEMHALKSKLTEAMLRWDTAARGGRIGKSGVSSDDSQ
jgi:vacuolar-type H+-ATPase subunit E/Vma4